MKNKLGFIILLFCTCMSFLFFGCSHYNLANDGLELAKAGNHLDATKKYFESLEIEPGYEKALNALRVSALPAYRQKLEIADNYEKQSNYETAVIEYKELYEYCNRLRRLSLLSFPTIDFEKKISEMKTGASETYYLKAEDFLNKNDFINAAENYKSALKHNQNYKDCVEKIANCYYLEKCSANQFRGAVSSWKKCWEFKPAYKDSLDKASEVQYNLAKYFEKKKKYRLAYNDYTHLIEFNPNYNDAAQRKDEVEQLAVTKVAFTPFENLTNRRFSGIVVDDIIFELTKGKVLSKGSRFMRIIDREELKSILNEQGLQASGIAEGSSKINQLKGVDYIIFGKINQLRSVPNSSSKTVRDTYQFHYDCNKQDRKGKWYVDTCSVDKPMTYTLNKAGLSVEIGGSIKVVDVYSGRTVLTYPRKEKESDQVEYATDPSIDPSSQGVSIYSNLPELLKARNQLTEESDMVDKIVKRIGDELGLKILTTVDITPNEPDPTNMLQERVG
ncbi:MAG: hypothetical protein KKH85_04635 [Proteobacteria bacterium]|nr:hypothetical protein [Pseudomonadota bacterium]